MQTDTDSLHDALLRRQHLNTPHLLRVGACTTRPGRRLGAPRVIIPVATDQAAKPRLDLFSVKRRIAAVLALARPRGD